MTSSGTPALAAADEPTEPATSAGVLVGAASALPALVTFSLCLALASRQGGIEPTAWLPAALLQLAVLVALAVAGRRVVVTRGTLLALGALAGLTAWTYLSILWADVRGPAWDGANLTAFYLLAFAALALWPVRPRAAAAVLTMFATGLVVLAAVVLREGSVANDPAASVLYAQRLAEPLGYPNATAVVFGMGAWGMLALSLQSWLGRWWRALTVGLAVALAQVDFLAQSRGAIYTAPVVLIVYFLLARRRVRAAVPVLILALVSAPAVPRLLDVYNSDGAAEQRDAFAGAAVAIAASGVVAAIAAGLLLPWLDRLPDLAANRRFQLRVAGLGAGLVVAVLALALASPVARADRAWEQFKAGAEEPVGSSRLGGLGSGRYDMWRVGLSEFQRQPVHGIGADNFAVPYLQDRRSGEQPEYPHSLIVKTLAQLGVVGALLLAAFLAFGLRPGFGADTPARGVGAAATVPFVAWLLHATVDWLWEIPAAGLTAFALIGLAAGVGGGTIGAAAVGRRRYRPAVALGAGAFLTLALAATLIFPWLSAKYEARAADSWVTQPAVADAALERAAQLNPLSDSPFLVRGAIASRRREFPLMRASFERALERHPLNWYAHLELAIALSQTSDSAAALEHADRAVALNPREPIVRRVQGALASGKRVNPASVDALFLEQLATLNAP